MLEAAVKVVVVDDDHDDFFLIKDYLSEIKDTRYVLEWIPTYKAAVESIKQQSADVYLIDYRLDGHTGLEILDSLHELNLKKPLILLTGHGDHHIDIEAMQKGVSDFLVKSKITADLLERAIRYSIKRAQDKEKIEEAEKLKIEKVASDLANQAKSQFLANMSHEIRTPLGVILGFSELAQDPSTSEEERINYMALIKRCGENLLEIINDILDLSKVEAGQLQIEAVDFNWQSITEEIIEFLKIKALSKGIFLNCEIDSAIPDTLKGDSHRFRQILMNLIGNAIKFTEAGHVTVKCKMEPDAQDSQKLVISVHDSGIGISLSDQKKLFKPFKQANSSLSRKYGGTGLGLDLSRKLARALGGDVNLVQSLPDVGSTFALSLPGHFTFCKLNYSNANAVPKEIMSAVEKSNLRVLLVDDAFENQVIVKHFLKNDFDVWTANNGREGILKAFDSDFDVILMDIQMPEMDGYEATQRLRQGGYKKPIIALTAYALNEEREKAIRAGFSDYVTKPIQREKLIATLNKYRNEAVETAERFDSYTGQRPKNINGTAENPLSG